MNIFEKIAPSHPEIDKALADALEDVRAGQLTPSFGTVEEYRAWRDTNEGKQFRAGDSKQTS